MIQSIVLRIGNYIYKCYPDGKEIAIVENISKCFLNGFGVSAIEPIPITEKRIRKCGFQEDGVWTDYILSIKHNRQLGINIGSDTCVVLISHYIKGIGFRDVFLRDIRYIHELQNLFFSLVNEELIFENFN